MNSLKDRFITVLTDAISDIKICEHTEIDKEHLENVVGELISIVKDEISVFLNQD